ncbi:proteophosphoglycan ppg4 [Rhodotorula toruloides]|uniref:Proteophosphoglycan ppg4 n=1 Tax=Rhodotorula toruloides TaxID=5286 RepID=A0A511KH77_RHOTO|nr:proteophosphoglycan ppg4 [Rhodotorula toruloides]
MSAQPSHSTTDPSHGRKDEPVAQQSSHKVPRSLKASDPSLAHAAGKLDQAAVQHGVSLVVSPEYDADTSDNDQHPGDRTITAKSHVAPGHPSTTTSESPSPLFWSESGWNAGTFTFAPFAGDEGDATAGAASARNDPSSNASSSSRASTSTPAPAEGLVKSRSKLAPTAQPFAPKSSSRALPQRTHRLPSLDLSTTLERFSFPAKGTYATTNTSPTTTSSLERCTPPPNGSQFDEEGHLVSQGAKYSIADEILQLQSAPLGPVHTDEIETLDDLDLFEHDLPSPVVPFPSSMASRLRTVSEQSAFNRGIEAWRLQQHPARFPPPQPALSSPSLAVTFERSRSSSLASTSSSYFPARPSFDRANTVAQLQSYFGPSTTEVNVPFPVEPYHPPAPYLSRAPSYASLAGPYAGPAPLAAHPEPFNLLPDDPLYLEARETFINASCSSLSGPPTPLHRQTMGAHFDKAMHTLNPLATLYGLSQEAANQLLADPAKSGVSDVVLRVAVMRGRQEQLASVQRSAMGQALPGPSPNNRKISLYKTELCRSWEEKGNCRYGVKCQFAHGVQELREVARHPKFKSEICRTFWHQGSCPYGKRCCFIHALPESESPASSPRKGSVAGSRSASPSRGGQARMTSTAITGAPSRTFGPALSELIGSTASSSSSVNGGSPKLSMKLELGAAPPTASPSSASTTHFESSALFGLGIRERPGQAPPVFKDAPQSRLQRLASLTGEPSSSSLASVAASSSPTVPTSSAAFGAPHTRHDSTHSFMTSSSASSPAIACSPLLAHSGSSSSLSSGAGSPVLHRVGHDWLSSSSASANAKNAALDWPAIEELALDDPTPLPPSSTSALAGRFY